MKKLKTANRISSLFVILFFTLLNSCSDNDDDVLPTLTNQTLTTSDSDALLFMLEEEKLARDTYSYLNNLWSLSQFANIKNSEQSHMDAIESLLISYRIEYNILPEGNFANEDLQEYYDRFVLDGAISQANALQIGATIEDLDIVDLQNEMDATTNTDIKAVFESLQCGSRNHLRSFVSSIENSGDTYIPQFLSQNEYDTIISGNHQQCN